MIEFSEIEKKFLLAETVESTDREKDFLIGLLPLKIAGYELTTILLVASVLTKKGGLPTHYHLVNNTHLYLPGGDFYSLETGEIVTPAEPRMFCLTIWIPKHGQYQFPIEDVGVVCSGTG